LSRTVAGTFALALVAAVASPAVAQEGALDQLKPLPRQGGPVSPMFDGWYENADGSYTLSFGYINLNTTESPNIPIGENNFIEPAQFNGVQPTYFPAVQYSGFGGRHERGVFAVTVPAEMAEEDVVWTVTHNGRTYRIPGRIGTLEYQLSHTPATEGSLPPSLRFTENGERGQGREGIRAEPMRTRVGQPIDLSVWAQDEGTRDPVEIHVTWFKHQGPGEVEFGTESTDLESGAGQATTTATFSAPGEYVVRARVDNFGAGDSRFGNQCCWSNGYVPVTVTE
jgi:hypothetical protein